MEKDKEIMQVFRVAAIALFLVGALAAIAFALLATHDTYAGIALIIGFAAMGANLLYRTVQAVRGEASSEIADSSEDRGVEEDEQSAEGEESEVEADVPSSRPRFGRSSFGGPGRPQTMSGALIILQIAVVTVSVGTGFDRQSAVLVGFFIVEDAIVWYFRRKILG